MAGRSSFSMGEGPGRPAAWMGVCFLMFRAGQFMNDDANASRKSCDPFEPFREMRDAYLNTLSKAMIDAVNTESYAEATGAMLDGYLTATKPFREALEKNMLQALQQLSLPSRQEVAALAERFTNFEMRLDDMDAKLDEIVKRLAEEKKVKPEAGSRSGEARSPAPAGADRPKAAATAPGPSGRRAKPPAQHRP